jgi:hypothetical protein
VEAASEVLLVCWRSVGGKVFIGRYWGCSV